MSDTTARERRGDWREAIGVLKGHFPEGMKSEDIIWCEYAGMTHDEFMIMLKAGVNPRDYHSTIASYSAYLWRMADDPAVVVKVAQFIFKRTDLNTIEMGSAQSYISTMLTALIGPRPESEATDAGN